ncbi:MAG: 6-bladed beta-propeller [Balneola sp.]
MLKKYFLALIGSILVFSCSSNDKKVDANIETIEVDPEEATEVFLSGFVDEIRFVKLSTEKNSLIGYIDKVRIVEDKIFVFDSYRAKGVFVYDMDGNALYNIVKPGSGPGEFLEPNDFVIDTTSNAIIIYDGSAVKFSHYDLDTGRFIKDQNLDFRLSSFWSTKDRYILFLNNHIFKDNRNNIIITDKNLEILSTSLKIRPDQKGFHYNLPRTFYEHKESVYFTAPSNYIIYRYKNNNFSEYIKLDVGDKNLPKGYFGEFKDWRDRFKLAENSIRAFSNYYEDDGFRYFTYFGDTIYFVLEFKNSGEVFHGVHNEITKDMGSGPLMGWPDDYFNKTLVYHQTPRQLYDYLNDKKQTMSEDEWDAFKFKNSDLLRFSQKATVDSNPYIIFLKLKSQN